jgi:mono/diheme cytochrome c family protein
MPNFQFNPAGTDALIAFLESIQVREPGRLLVEERCARCHSIAKAGASPYPGAQPFRTLGRRWTRDQLAQALHAGILAEHDRSGVRFEMQLNDQEIADFLAFLDSLAMPGLPAPR